MDAKLKKCAFVFLLVLGLAMPRLAGSRSSPAFPNKDGLVRGVNGSADAQTPAAAPPATPLKPSSVFSFSFDVTLPAVPAEVYDALTGDISGWWDHHFSEKPYRLYIEAKPGGGFYEIFDAGGDGARHATVILAERGKRLRFDGPLGLSGQAIQTVTSYDLAPAEKDGTVLTVSVHGAGEMDEKLPGVVEKVWKHFILERFKPYIESGAYKKPRR